jgi:hypothetical protein
MRVARRTALHPPAPQPISNGRPPETGNFFCVFSKKTSKNALVGKFFEKMRRRV